MEGDLPDGWRLQYRPLPGRLLGETVWPTMTITIDPRCPAASQRCTLQHELIHIERGPVPRDAVLAAREDLAVEKAAARRLIGVRGLGEALAESDHLGHVAELLHVDPDTLTVRLNHLHPAERAYLKNRLENR
jgi:hypothetical protein